MKLQEFIERMQERGWVLDRFGHLKKHIPRSIGDKDDTIEHRIKIQKISVRLERRPFLEITGEKRWYLMSSCYIKDITMTEDGGIVIGRVTIRKGKQNAEATA